MSYKATNWAYELPLKGSAKPVLTALADMADEEGTCYPGQDMLAQMTGMSVSSVGRALKRLEQLGLITREHRYGPAGYRTSDRYRLQLSVTMPERLPVNLPTGQSAYRSNEGRLPVNLHTPTGHSDSAEENHQIEPPVEPPATTRAHEARDSMFERCWTHWPRKDSRKKALEKFHRLPASEIPKVAAAIIAHGDAYTAHDYGQFTPHLITWLNGERWNDPLPLPRGKPEYMDTARDIAAELARRQATRHPALEGSNP